MEPHDLVIIGSGVAAEVAAAKALKADWRVAVIDERPFGGTCALRGCDPKKVLVSGAEAVDAAARMGRHGTKGEIDIDWSELMRFKRSFTDPVPEERKKRYAQRGITALNGHAQFAAPNAIAVNGEEFEARYILLAMGAKPIPLGIPGEEYIIPSDQFLELDRLPTRIVLVGGGFIAAEFAHIAARAGAKVTILEAAERLLAPFDPDCVSWLLEKFETLGVSIKTETPVERIEKHGAAYTVHARNERIDADLVVHAAGRAPALDSLNLEKGEVATDNGRLKLNDFLQSETNPIVYAAGDAAAKGPLLTPVSAYDGGIAAANMLEGARQKPDYKGLASVAFTIPPIAAAGMSEEEARARHSGVRVKSERVSSWFSARREGEPVYGYKTIVDNKTDKILGAHLVGPHAEEVINLFALAIRHGLTKSQLRDTLLAYPTSGSDIGSMF